MNLTDFKNAVAKKLGLSEDTNQDSVWTAFCEKFDTAIAEKQEALEKLAKLKEEHKVLEVTEADFEKAALEGMKITGSNSLFVGSDLRCYLQETYCRENSKFVYYKAEKAGDKVTLTKIQK